MGDIQNDKKLIAGAARLHNRLLQASILGRLVIAYYIVYIYI